MARLSLILILLALTAKSFEQTVSRYTIASTGNSVVLSDFSISSTVGQLPFLTIHDNCYFLTQGFQQPTPKIPPQPENSILVYPNPVKDLLFLYFTMKESKNFKISIYALSGMEVQSIYALKLEPGSLYTIDFSKLSDGFYLIYIYEIYREKKLSKVLKIEKIGNPI